MRHLVRQDWVLIVEENDSRPPARLPPGRPPPLVTHDTARQGPLGVPVLLLLAGSFGLIAVTWLLIAIFVP